MSTRTRIAKHRFRLIAKAMRTCTIIIVLTLALSSANADAYLRKSAIEQEITARYNFDATTHAVLGPDHSAMTCSNAGSTFSCHQVFSGGEIYWSQKTGARYLTNAPLHDHWVSTGGAEGPYGLPTGNSAPLAGKGTYQDFTFGSLVYSPAAGTHNLTGAIRSKWFESGAEDGPLGYPTSKEHPTGEGRAQKFHSGTIY